MRRRPSNVFVTRTNYLLTQKYHFLWLIFLTVYANICFANGGNFIIRGGKMNRNTSFIVVQFMLSAFVLLFAFPALAAPSQSSLNSSDCIKCHSAQPSQIDANGGRHKSKVTCQDCHAGHRPSSKNNIPQCNQCHQGKPHFLTPGCLNCHQNPHTPLNITFAKKLTEPCLTCHVDQNKQLTTHKSKHSLLGCSTCHDVHRKKPACTQCHKSHSSEITAADCNKCHKVHMPKDVRYASDTESKYCAACHVKQNKLLTSSQAMHGTFTCAFCHQEKHKMVPNCKDCHGEKHPAGIMAKFPTCGECHKIAHDLNNWTGPAESGSGLKPKKKTAQ